MGSEVKIARALISVTDKTGVVDFARTLVDDFGVEIISTGGTARALSLIHICIPAGSIFFTDGAQANIIAAVISVPIALVGIGVGLTFRRFTPDVYKRQILFREVNELKRTPEASTL